LDFAVAVSASVQISRYFFHTSWTDITSASGIHCRSGARGKLTNPCSGVWMAKKSKTKVVAYNPLDKLNLAKSIEQGLLARPADSLGSLSDIFGAGVYAIYYTGLFTAYAPLAKANAGGNFSKPIYVGKAIPKGGRKGGLAKDLASTGKALLDRLKQHASSISEADNLELKDFFVRYLVVDDIWIPLGENMLIETFQPVWNRVIDGFGNKDPGQRRATQYKSPWDILHPGRESAKKLADSPITQEFLLKRVVDYFAGKPLEKLPRQLAEQQAELAEEAEELADELGTEKTK